MIRGSCLCRGVTFELTAPPERASYCHCTRCQKRTGTGASAQAEIDAGTLRLLTGDELLRGYDPGDGGWVKTFCSVCGSSLFSRDPEGTRMSVRMGAFDGDPGVRPQYRQRTATAAAWEPIPDDGLPRYEESNTR